MSRILPIQQAYKQLLSKGRLSANPGQAALVDRLAGLQQVLTGEQLTTPATKDNGVYIYGDVGTGKSRIADLFVTTLPATIPKRRVHFNEFMMDTHMRLHRARSKADYNGDPLLKIGREIYEESQVLCFDEFQVSDIADAMILKRLFGAFWDSGGIVVSTSNRHPTQLYENGLNRPLFIPFIKELQRRCEVWKIEGKQDYRMSSQQHEAPENICFFTDSNPFDASLARATNGRPLVATTIKTVTNRDILVEATEDPKTENTSLNDNVVHTSFTALCEANLGAIDYHGICKFASTIYLSGLRQFRPDELDFLRRFITLIDIAYEYKTRLICLSSVSLAEVFEKVIIKTSKSKDAEQQGSSQLPADTAQGELRKALSSHKDLSVKREGGSSSSMMSTFIGEMEWSATGLREASLATGGAGETDVRFAVGRAISRLYEMNSTAYGTVDD